MKTLFIALIIGKRLRKYFIALLLVTVLAGSLVSAALWGTGPMPQQPPEGYELTQGRAVLQWNKGTRKNDIILQVSIDDPSFNTPLVDKKVTGTTHRINALERGKRYYWRLIQNNNPSPTSSFKVSKYNVKF